MHKHLLWGLIGVGIVALLPVIVGSISSYMIGVFALCGIYVILAVSLDLLVGYTGQISLGHNAFFAIGAYSSALLTTQYNLSPVQAIIVGIVLAGILAWLIGKPVLKLKGYYLAMATLGLGVVVHSLIIGLRDFTGGGSGIRAIPHFEIFGIQFASTFHYYYLVWGIALVIIFISLAIVNSPVGRALIAIHGDETVASSFGVDCAKYKINIFIISCMFASIAGALLAHYMRYIAPDDFAFLTAIHILVMVNLGGTGTIFGPILGGVFLTLLPELTFRFHYYELFLNGFILVLVLLFMPKGLWGIILSIKNILVNQKTVSLRSSRL